MRKRLFIPGLLTVLVLLSACSSGSEKPGNISGIAHPLENSYLNLDEYETFTIPENIDTTVETKFSNARQIMLEGQFFGDEHKTFGMVTDILVDSNGNVFVLETETNEIRMFDKDGNFVQKFGGAGRGPGEYRQPEAIELIETDENLFLLVADGFYKVDVYNVSESELVETLTVDYTPKDICYTNNSLFIHGFRNPEETQKIIHRYERESTTFSYVNSFGDMYPSDNNWISRRLGEVQLSCNDNRTVTTVNKKFPLLHHYNAETGDLLWKRYIEGQQLRPAVEGKRGGRTTLVYDTNDSKVDMISSMISEGSSLYMQYIRGYMSRNISLEKILDENKIYTIKVDLNTGEGEFLGSGVIPLADKSGIFLASADIERSNFIPKIALYEVQ